jgi:guanosine-3',5'-bis(diphosphate) 3'-pyrophosphohydrolase
MNEQDRVEREARRYAEAAHGDQKYGDTPYVSHLIAVRAVLSDFGFGGDLGVAAWLHDLLEDTSTTPSQLELSFGSSVTKLVQCVTGEGKNRKERVECTYGRIEQNPQAVVLKLADRIANVEACARLADPRLEMYRKEHPTFKTRLGKLLNQEPRVIQMWNRLERAFEDVEPSSSSSTDKTSERVDSCKANNPGECGATSSRSLTDRGHSEESVPERVSRLAEVSTSRPDFVKVAEQFVEEFLHAGQEIVAPLATELHDAFNAGYRAGGRVDKAPTDFVLRQRVRIKNIPEVAAGWRGFEATIEKLTSKEWSRAQKDTAQIEGMTWPLEVLEPCLETVQSEKEGA